MASIGAAMSFLGEFQKEFGGLCDDMRAVVAERDKLRDLAGHLRYCRACGETGVMDCDEGKELWLECFPESES